MTRVSFARGKVLLTATALIGFSLALSGCARHHKAIPNWGSTTPPVTSSQPRQVYVSPPVQTVETPAPMGANGRLTFTQGCSGNYSVRDARTNREISSGRAYNSGRGMIALDRSGRQTSAIASSTGQSVIFLPDCNCRAGGNQTGELPTTYRFATTAPTGAACSAG